MHATFCMSFCKYFCTLYDWAWWPTSNWACRPTSNWALFQYRHKRPDETLRQMLELMALNLDKFSRPELLESITKLLLRQATQRSELLAGLSPPIFAAPRGISHRVPE
jgi:hypothetical protein